MEKKDNFTNEYLRKKFVNQFDMVNAAIHRAEDLIKRGDAPHLSSDSQNIALHVIKMIEKESDPYKFTSYREEEDEDEDVNGYDFDEEEEVEVVKKNKRKSK